MDVFTLEVEQLGPDAALIIGRGELSIGTAPRLATRIGELVSRGVTRIVVDLDEVVFVDSTGMGFLLNGLRRISRADGRLALVVPPGHVRRVFELTRLDHVFHLEETRAAALEHLGLPAAAPGA